MVHRFLPYAGRFGEKRPVAVIGYSWRSEESRLDAILLNLQVEQGSQTLVAEAAGTSMIPAFGLGLALPGRSLLEACRQLGGRIADVVKAQAARGP